jgi:hypothetical protein
MAKINDPNDPNYDPYAPVGIMYGDEPTSQAPGDGQITPSSLGQPTTTAPTSAPTSFAPQPTSAPTAPRQYSFPNVLNSGTSSTPSTYTGAMTTNPNGGTVSGQLPNTGPNGSYTPNANEAPPTGLNDYTRKSTIQDSQLADIFKQVTSDPKLGVGAPDLTNHGSLQMLSTLLGQKGIDVQMGPTDKAGRQDSLFLNGTLYRVIDSSGKWTLVSNAGGTAWGDSGPNGEGSGGQGGQTGAAGSGSINASSIGQGLGSGDPRDQLLWNQIQGLIGQGNTPVDGNDPIIKGQVDAYRNEQTRGARQGQAALAEQAAYKGIPSGTQDAGTAGLYENAGVHTGNFEAQLVSQELQARRAQLTQGLQLALSQNSGDQARQLQAQIAQIDAALRQQTITNQNGQFYDSLGLDAGRLEALLNAQLVNQMQG